MTAEVVTPSRCAGVDDCGGANGNGPRNDGCSTAVPKTVNIAAAQTKAEETTMAEATAAASAVAVVGMNERRRQFSDGGCGDGDGGGGGG